jgi:hypothetical protein
MHLNSLGYLTSYAPENKLGHPAEALFGFDGVVGDSDPSPAPPMSVRGIVVSAWLFAIGASLWAVKTLWKRWRSKS